MRSLVPTSPANLVGSPLALPETSSLYSRSASLQAPMAGVQTVKVDPGQTVGDAIVAAVKAAA